MGRGIVKAVSDAKEISVNFNTKGAQDGKGFAGMTAMYLGAFKYFFNASVQGSQNFWNMFKNNKVKFCSTACGMVGLGMMMPVIQGTLWGLIGGDDDEYWNIPEYERQNNLCIVIGKTGKYVKIPLPIGFREMYGIGDIMAAAALDKKIVRDYLTVGIEIANKISAMSLPLNPLEGSANGLSLIESAVEMVRPDATQFINQNETNRDWKGTPLQKEYTYNENDPQWTKAFASNPSWLTGLSKWCYEHIAVEGKALDFSPEKLDNTFSNLFGGVYALVKKCGKTVENVMNEEWDEVFKAPVVGVFVGSGIHDDGRFVNSTYWEMDEYYNDRIGRIKHTASSFGLTLDEVFKRVEEGDTPTGAHHPAMSKIYNSDYFDFMQEWYLGHKGEGKKDEYNSEVLGLDQIRNRMKTVENNIKKNEDGKPTEEQSKRLAELEAEYDRTRADLVYDLLEID
jgi:hypothetical protein